MQILLFWCEIDNYPLISVLFISFFRVICLQFQHMLSARLNRKVARLNYSHGGAGRKVKVYHHHRTTVHGHKHIVRS